MVIDYCHECFHYGARKIPFTMREAGFSELSIIHERRHFYFMMIVPPSLLPEMTDTRRKLIAGEW